MLRRMKASTNETPMLSSELTHQSSAFEREMLNVSKSGLQYIEASEHL